MPNLAHQRRYNERKAKGLCQFCDNPVEEGKVVRCEIHREITADYCAGRRDIWKLKGLCSKCGKNQPEKGKFTCKDCLAKSREYHKSRKEKQNNA